MQFGELVRAKGAAAASLVKQACEHKHPKAKVISRPEECDDDRIPENWLALLQSQLLGEEIPWEVVWQPAASYLPSLMRFLRQKCCGVGIIVHEEQAPLLAYVFLGSSGAPWFYCGRLPAPSLAKERLGSLKLPTAFKAFYQSVHNGFLADVGAWIGLIPLGSWRPLCDMVSEEDAFEDLAENPYTLSDMTSIFEFGNGNCICADLGRSNSRRLVGGTYWHEEPAECVFNENVRQLINERIETWEFSQFVDREK